jgi:iron complex transport system substrate-binding protein
LRDEAFRMIGRTATLLGAIAAVVAAYAGARAAESRPAIPKRVVSINLCADQLAILLARPGQLISVTWLSADPAMSRTAEQARRIPHNHGQAEEVLPLKPDLVLAGPLSAATTTQLLRRFGHKVLVVPFAATFDRIRANVRLVARALGTAERGREIIAEFDRRLAAARPAPGSPRPVAVIYQSRGYSFGRGTLEDETLRAAGFRNLADTLGMRGSAFVPLEILLTRRFDAIVLPEAISSGPSLAREVLEHPALRHRLKTTPKIAMPNALWLCGTPATAEAVERLAVLRRRVLSRKAAPSE